MSESKRGIPVGEIKEYKIVNKNAALDSLAKIKAMFIERREISGKNGGAIQHEVTSLTQEQARRIAREYLINAEESEDKESEKGDAD